VNVSELPCESEPLNVSVVGPVVEGEDELSNGLHAGMLITETRTSPI
jgi:hypothetical protein